MKTLLLALSLGVAFASPAEAKNMHIIDRNELGFSVVRTGKPNLKDFRELCRIGVRKMIVMSGNGRVERKWAKTECPGFEVVYDHKQTSAVPLSVEFLTFFDQQVAEAKAGNYGIAFRCNCGCHRTGRLAAYYRMKTEGICAADALKDQRRRASGLIPKLMWRKAMKYQIRALEEYIQGRPCTQKQKYCVIPNEREFTQRELMFDEIDD